MILKDMLTLETENFRLRIEPVSTQYEEPGGAYLEWINTQISMAESGVAAKGRWSVMPAELRQFLRQLQAMNTHGCSDQTAELSGAEHNFKLTLQLTARGTIIGNWRFQPVPPDGAVLSGQCGFDQTWLDELIQGVKSLLPDEGADRKLSASLDTEKACKD